MLAVSEAVLLDVFVPAVFSHGSTPQAFVAAIDPCSRSRGPEPSAKTIKRFVLQGAKTKAKKLA